MLCFTAPVVIHRLYFRQGQKERVVWLTHWLALVGMVLFMLGMALALWLVLTRVWSQTAATWSSLGVFLLAGGVWFILPRIFIGAPPRPGAASDPPTSRGTQ